MQRHPARSTRQPIEAARIDWSGPAPRNARYGDVYFDGDDGLAETRHVFINGIDAPTIWSGRRDFVIGETGFGTGLNFLATWLAWRHSGTAGRLWFLSTEGFPVSAADIVKATRDFAPLAPLLNAFIAQYPPAEAGLHQLIFDDGAVRLLLAIGPVLEALSMFRARMDAWYLDGFAPACNPEMWSGDVIGQIAALSRPNARLATFTAAGQVRRRLQQAGFHVEKRSGFGRKRECLTGRLDDADPRPVESAPPGGDWAGLPPPRNGPIAVIGSGIAGASAARALSMRGRDVTVFRNPGFDPSSNLPGALIAPNLASGEGAFDRFQSASFLYALRYHGPLHAGERIPWMGRRGVVRLEPDRHSIDRRAADRQAAVLACRAWPATALRRVSAAEARELTGMPTEQGGLWVGEGGMLDSRSVIDAALTDLEIIHMPVGALIRDSGGWTVRSTDGGSLWQFTTVLIAAGSASGGLVPGFAPPWRYRRGQIMQIEPRIPLKRALQYGDYIAPITEREESALIGATYSDWDDPADSAWTRMSDGDREELARRAHDRFPELQFRTRGDWAGLRTTLPDHLPLAGGVPDDAAYRAAYSTYRIDARSSGLGPPAYQDGMYILSGFGSKGFQTAPLAGEFLASVIDGGPIPVETAVADALHPGRFTVRSLKRSGHIQHRGGN